MAAEGWEGPLVAGEALAFFFRPSRSAFLASAFSFIRRSSSAARRTAASVYIRRSLTQSRTSALPQHAYWEQKEGEGMPTGTHPSTLTSHQPRPAPFYFFSSPSSQGS